MIKKHLLLFCILPALTALAQEKPKGNLISELSDQVCKCIDSIPKSIRAEAISYRINTCIDEMAIVYQLGSKIESTQDVLQEKDKTKNQDVNLNVNVNKESVEYKKYYYEMESYLMTHCPSLKKLMATNDEQRQFSMSDNPKALEAFYEGNKETQNENWAKAVELFQKR